MAASYPGAVKSFSAVVNGVTKLVASLFNSPYDEITAIETELGTDVAGSKSDLKERLAVSIENDGTLKAGVTSSPFIQGQADNYKIDSGVVGPFTGGSTQTITFNFTFANSPVLLLTIKQANTGHDMKEPYILTLTTTEATVWVNYNVSDMYLEWIAIGTPA